MPKKTPWVKRKRTGAEVDLYLGVFAALILIIVVLVALDISL
jgi:hypothetical protein